MRRGGAAGLGVGLTALLPSYARAFSARQPQPLRGHKVGEATVFDLTIAETQIEIAGKRGTATTINGTVPGPLLELREGQEAILRVRNQLDEDTSVHWHGLLVPPEMDGVPGLSFAGIRPRQVFEYRFPLRQYGTYWYHSHSGLQEQLGLYGPLVIRPPDGKYPFDYDREHFVVLSDWTFENPARVLAKLKKQPDYYNFQKRTVVDLWRDVRDQGLLATARDRWMWSSMRMNPTDIADITSATYTYLMNGLDPAANWTGLFKAGERVLLHFINAAAGTFFDVRIPGLPMEVVETNGQPIQPVETDEFRIAIAETYSVLVTPRDDRPYTVFAETMDRSGFARGTLAPRTGQSGPIPARRKRPILSMADMGMDHGEGHGAHGAASAAAASRPEGHEGGHGKAKDDLPATGAKDEHAAHAGHASTHDRPETAAPAAAMDSSESGRVAVAGRIRTAGLRPPGTLAGRMTHESDEHGPGNAAVPQVVRNRLEEPGLGLGQDGWRVLRYTDLKARERRRDFRPPTREIEVHLTGNMERFMWSFDGVPFSESKPIVFQHNERLRLTMVNDTMMNHPMHLHGMWMELENGHGELIPRVHTVNVKPAEHLSLLITADAPGKWAFHCHILYHMEVGMFRVVEVKPPADREKVSEHDHAM